MAIKKIEDNWTVIVKEGTEEKEYKFIDEHHAVHFAEKESQHNRLCWVISSNGENPSN